MLIWSFQLSDATTTAIPHRHALLWFLISSSCFGNRPVLLLPNHLHRHGKARTWTVHNEDKSVGCASTVYSLHQIDTFHLHQMYISF